MAEMETKHKLNIMVGNVNVRIFEYSRRECETGQTGPLRNIWARFLHVFSEISNKNCDDKAKACATEILAEAPPSYDTRKRC